VHDGVDDVGEEDEGVEVEEEGHVGMEDGLRFLSFLQVELVLLFFSHGGSAL
jgi:hypothetical protein